MAVPRGLLASSAAGVVETSERCRIDKYDQKENSKEAVPSRARVSFFRVSSLELWFGKFKTSFQRIRKVIFNLDYPLR